VRYTSEIVELLPGEWLVMRTEHGRFPVRPAMRRANQRDLARLKAIVETSH
jgi:hypothetical protein